MDRRWLRKETHCFLLIYVELKLVFATAEEGDAVVFFEEVARRLLRAAATASATL